MNERHMLMFSSQAFFHTLSVCVCVCEKQKNNIMLS